MRNWIILAEGSDGLEQYLEYGSVVVVSAVMYALVVKVVAPIIAAKFGGTPNGGQGSNTEETLSRIDSIGERIERTVTQRLKATEKRNDRIEIELHEIRNGLSETGIALSAAATTLAFLKERMEKN
jgi:hypothetical protein